jgi:hypothetical protein
LGAEHLLKALYLQQKMLQDAAAKREWLCISKNLDGLVQQFVIRLNQMGSEPLK